MADDQPEITPIAPPAAETDANAETIAAAEKTEAHPQTSQEIAKRLAEITILNRTAQEDDLRQDAEAFVSVLLLHGQDFENPQLKSELYGVDGQSAGLGERFKSADARANYLATREGLKELLDPNSHFFNFDQLKKEESGHLDAEREVIKSVALLMLRGLTTAETLKTVLPGGVRYAETTENIGANSHENNTAHYDPTNRQIVVYKQLFELAPPPPGQPGLELDPSGSIDHEFTHAMTKLLLNQREFNRDHHENETVGDRPPRFRASERANVRDLLQEPVDQVRLLKPRYVASLLEQRNALVKQPDGTSHQRTAEEQKRFEYTLINEDFAEMGRIAARSDDLAQYARNLLGESYLVHALRSGGIAADSVTGEQFATLALEFFERTQAEVTAGEPARFIEKFQGKRTLAEAEITQLHLDIKDFVASRFPEQLQPIMEQFLDLAVDSWARINLLRDKEYMDQVLPKLEGDPKDRLDDELFTSGMMDMAPLSGSMSSAGSTGPDEKWLSWQDVSKVWEILTKG